MIGQHELPITGVSEQGPQSGSRGNWTKGAQSASPHCPDMAFGTVSMEKDSSWSGKGADKHKREEQGERTESAWATLQGSMDTHEADRSFPPIVTWTN